MKLKWVKSFPGEAGTYLLDIINNNSHSIVCDYYYGHGLGWKTIQSLSKNIVAYYPVKYIEPSGF